MSINFASSPALSYSFANPNNTLTLLGSAASIYSKISMRDAPIAPSRHRLGRQMRGESGDQFPMTRHRILVIGSAVRCAASLRLAGGTSVNVLVWLTQV